MDKILLMLQLQNQLNDATNGDKWTSGVTKNGKTINWSRCIYMECAEMVDSFSWKHWKNIDARPDYANIKIEAVDIWHFIMSQGLEDYKRGELGSIETLAKNINDLANFSAFSGEIKEHFKDYYEQIAVVEVLMKTLFCGGSTEKLM